jgi:hypothetical protein
MVNVISRDQVFNWLNPLFGDVLHKKRVLSLSLATLAVCVTRRLGVAELGRNLAGATGKNPKHGIKQIDRFLSNEGIDLGDLSSPYVRWVVAQRDEAVLVLDWTSYEGQKLATITISLVTSHGRATPLAWRTVSTDDLEGMRNTYEDDLIQQVAEAMPKGVRVTLLADRGFGDTKLYAFLKQLGWGYVIRFRGCIHVATASEPARPASDWVLPGGRVKAIRRARVTADAFEVPVVVCVQKPDMKEAWCLASSRSDLSGAETTKLYGRRFTIEETFRDEKDDRFGLGAAHVDIKSPERRDRLLLILALARCFLTLLGVAGSQVGADKTLRANTEKKKRTHAFFTQGRLYALGIGVFGSLLAPLMNAFTSLLDLHPRAQDLLGFL